MNELTDKMINDYSNEELIILKDNINNYIVPLNKKKIKWKVLKAFEMEQFINENYSITWLDLGEESVFGMTLLPFPPYNDNLSFLVGTIKNKLNKETLVGCISYCNNFELGEKYNALTFIEIVEINYFYQGLGLLNIMLDKFCKVINQKQNIIMTMESSKGRICRIMKHLKTKLNMYSFKKDIRFQDDINDKYVKSLRK